MKLWEWRQGKNWTDGQSTWLATKVILISLATGSTAHPNLADAERYYADATSNGLTRSLVLRTHAAACGTDSRVDARISWASPTLRGAESRRGRVPL